MQERLGRGIWNVPAPRAGSASLGRGRGGPCRRACSGVSGGVSSTLPGRGEAWRAGCSASTWRPLPGGGRAGENGEAGAAAASPRAHGRCARSGSRLQTGEAGRRGPGRGAPRQAAAELVSLSRARPEEPCRRGGVRTLQHSEAGSGERAAQRAPSKALSCWLCRKPLF